MSGAIVEARAVSKVFPMPAGPVTAVRELSLAVGTGDYVAVCGPSGCGKSTLLHLLGCVDTPTAGTLLLEGRDVSSLPDAERSARFRCVLALVDPRTPEAEPILVSGTCEGHIAHAPRGEGGFGYDPVFVPVGHDLTISELGDAEKDALSHRGLACSRMRPVLARLGDQTPSSR